MGAFAGALGCSETVADGDAFDGMGTVAQAPESGTGVGSSDAADADAAESEADGGPVLDVAGNSPGGVDGACPCAATELVVLVADDSSVWTFDPASLAFEPIGALDCPTQGEFMAMALDRESNLVLVYVGFGPDGIVPESFVAPLDDLGACETTTLGVPADRWLAGMGYASRSGEDVCEDLYVFTSAQSESDGSSSLGRVDRQTGEYAELGAVSFEAGHLTGTADGRLFGFAGGTTGASLVHFDKQDARVVDETPIPGVNGFNGLGFAFWGGDVWFFTDSAMAEQTSRVTRLDLDVDAGGGAEVVVEPTPARFLGAGVSTCAPVSPEG